MIRHPVAIWARWLLLFALVTFGFTRLTELPALRVAHGVLAYLLLIVGASREGGRWLTGTMLVLGYLAVDWLFVPPRQMFGNASERDVIILVGFASTAAVVSQLVLSLRAAVTLATERTAEVEHLSRERLALQREALRVTALERAERLKHTLIRSIAHDLRTPIATMAMLTDPASAIGREAALSRVRAEVGRLDAFIATLGRFTSVADDDALLAVESHVVDDLVGAAITSAESVLARHPVRVVRPTVNDADMVLVTCDFTLTLQILRNLLENAARYAPAGSLIEITVGVRDDGSVALTVMDRGPGLAPEEISEVFEPLRRGLAGRTTLGGMGMGLAIARTFAQVQLGDVTYAPREGGGACFQLTLPRVAEPSLANGEQCGGSAAVPLPASVFHPLRAHG